jgi:probable phosphoglycerate mutase
VINLLLIRHAEAEANVRRIVGGVRGDTGLTARGVAQAERLRDRLAATGEIAADVLLASSLRRAHQTAEILAPALGLPVVLDDELHELRPGEADGLPLDEAVARFGSPDFAHHPERPVSPGGESWAAFMARVAGALARIAAAHEGRTVVVVTHGGVVDGAFVHFLRLGAGGYLPAQFTTRHTALTHWQHRPRFDGTTAWHLLGFNDATHLADVDGPRRIPWEALGPASRGRA